MAQSYVLYSGNGSQDTFTVSFPYLSQEHVTVEVAGVEVDFSWLSVSSIQTDAPPASGTNNVRVLRTTPTDAQEVDWQDGSNMVEEDLDTADLQLLYIAQEQADALADKLGLTTDNATWDAASKKIASLATPTVSTDAATKAYVDDIASEAGNVPGPEDPTDDGKVLTASGGTFDWESHGAALLAVKALTPAADKLPYFTSSSAGALADLSAFGRQITALADAGAARTLFGSQAADAMLTAIAALTSADNKAMAFSGADVPVLVDFMRSAATWTPALSFASGSVTYTAQGGKYAVIGPVAVFTGRLAVDTVSSPSGATNLTGLPVAVPNSNANFSVMALHPQSWASSLTTPLVGRFESNDTKVRIQKYAATGGAGSEVGADVANGSVLFFFGAFLTS